MTAFEALFVPAELREAVSGTSWLEAMLAVESGLARACGATGVIPTVYAEAIAAACADVDAFRWEELLRPPRTPLTTQELDALLDPLGCLGSAETLVDRALDRYDAENGRTTA